MKSQITLLACGVRCATPAAARATPSRGRRRGGMRVQERAERQPGEAQAAVGEEAPPRDAAAARTRFAGFHFNPRSPRRAFSDALIITQRRRKRHVQFILALILPARKK